jgi:hypothetical protein
LIYSFSTHAFTDALKKTLKEIEAEDCIVHMYVLETFSLKPEQVRCPLTVTLHHFLSLLVDSFKPEKTILGIRTGEE